MLKHNKIVWIPWIIFIGILFLIWLSMTGCGTLQHFENEEQEGMTYYEGAPSGTPALPKDVPLMISTSTFKTLEDFWKSVDESKKWLKKKGYWIYEVREIYGYDMTRKEVLRFVCLYYKEIK